MDKQIIDVTQCPYYKEDKTCTYLPYKSKCEGDCNWTAYKEMEEQLKRKEQECEELLKFNNSLVEEHKTIGNDLYKEIKDYRIKLDQLKAENDELKKKCNIYTCGICGNKDDCNKLYRTLAEIKEIAESQCVNGCNCIDKKRILQKISECEGNDEN